MFNLFWALKSTEIVKNDMLRILCEQIGIMKRNTRFFFSFKYKKMASNVRNYQWICMLSILVFQNDGIKKKKINLKLLQQIPMKVQQYKSTDAILDTFLNCMVFLSDFC